MFKSFQYNDELSIFNKAEKDRYIEIGKEALSIQKETISRNLKDFYSENGVLDGTKLKKSWFPTIKAHVFLSHSHADEDDVMALAGYLQKEFHIISFIDSNVWGSANDLLKEIDNSHCRNADSDTYNYSARNFSTSHIHMMLNTALMEMIDKTECVIFIKTANSVETIKETISHGTYSPWIYSELNMIKFMKIRPPERTIERVEKDFGDKEKRMFFESLQIQHDVSSEIESLPVLKNIHLTRLLKEFNNEMEMKKRFDRDSLPTITLDNLYDMFGNSK